MEQHFKIHILSLIKIVKCHDKNFVADIKHYENIIMHLFPRYPRIM